MGFGVAEKIACENQLPEEACRESRKSLLWILSSFEGWRS